MLFGPVGLDDEHPYQAHQHVNVGLYVAVIEERARVFRGELVAKGLAGA